MKINEKHVIDTFAAYTDRYDAKDPKIKLKIDHTYRVAGLCRQIAASIGLGETEQSYAWLSGMLHDVGRFEQVRRYGTFNDAESVSHAELGADLLFIENLYEDYVAKPCPKIGCEAPKHEEMEKEEAENEGKLAEYDKLRNLMEIAIRNHSNFRIAEGLSEEEVMYCNILRDADKIDILRVNCDTPPEEIYNVTTEELKNSPVAEEVKESFRQGKVVLRAIRRYPADYLVGHICLVFELVYPKSRELAKSQGYLDQLLGFEFDCEDTRAWFATMRRELPDIWK